MSGAKLKELTKCGMVDHLTRFSILMTLNNYVFLKRWKQGLQDENRRPASCHVAAATTKNAEAVRKLIDEEARIPWEQM